MNANYPYLSDLVESVALGKRAPELPVYTPVPTTWDDETKTYLEAFNNVVCGEKCDFYPDEDDVFAYFDLEQADPMLTAIRTAASLIGATDAERWRVVLSELTRQAERYAALKAKEAGE